MFSNAWKAAALVGWLLFIAVSGVALWLFESVRDLEHGAGKAENAGEQCTAATADNTAANVDLAERLEQCVAAKAGHALELAEIAAAHATAVQTLTRDHETERQERDHLYETDPDCAALARVPVCAAIADRLR